MGKALFLSFILHSAVVAIVVLFFKDSTLVPQQKSKSISLVNVILKKSEGGRVGSGDERQKQKQSKMVQKSIQKKPTQTTTAKAVNSKQVVKKLPKKQKKRPVAKRVTQKKVVKKAYKSKMMSKVHKHKQKALKKLTKLSHKKSRKSSKQTRTKVTHSKPNKLFSKKKKIKTHASKNINSSIYRKTKQADDSKIKAQIYQAINRSTRVPRLARKLGILGEVYTCFRVAPGKIVSDISTSGGHPILQKEARATINRASYSFPTISHTMHLCINIKWR